MKNFRRLNTITLIFISIMLFFTIFSKDLYKLTLPKVMTARVIEKTLPVSFTNEEGLLAKTTTNIEAIPKSALYSNSVLTLEEREDGLYIVPVEIVTNEEKDGWIGVESGVSKGTKIVIGCDRRLEAGMKVLEVLNNDK